MYTFARMNLISRSIVWKLMLLFFVVGITSLTIVGIYAYYRAKKAILQRTLDQLTSIRVMKKSQIKFLFDERQKMLDLISGSEGFRQGSLADTLITGFGQLYIMTRGSDSAWMAYSQSDSCWKPVQSELMRRQLTELAGKNLSTGNHCLTDLFLRFQGDTIPVCLIGNKVTPGSSSPVSFIAMEIPVTEINSIMLERSSENGLGESGEAYLVGADTLMRSNSRFIPHSVLRTMVNTEAVKSAFNNQTGLAIIDDYRTIPVLSSFSSIEIPGLNWVILAEIDYNEAMIPIITIRNDMLILSLIISIFILSVARIISRTVSQPVIRLKDAALRVGEGHLDVRVDQQGNDEIGVLTRAFNRMIRQLEQERNSRMAALYDGQELERQRISRELHDGLGQKLVALKMKFELNRSTPDELRDDFIRTLDEVRRVSYDLAPAGISEFGLDGSLGLFCQSVQHDTGVLIDFTSFGSFTGMGMQARNYLFRITQEAVSNAIRHGRASQVEISLNETPGTYILMIEDNGAGFCSEDPGHGNGNGLFNIRERTRLLGGNFSLESTRGGGCTLRIKIPKNQLSE